MTTTEVALIGLTVAVEDNPALVAELQTLVADRLLFRKAIGECLEIAASGRIDKALQVLRRACPEEGLGKVGAGETAVTS